MSRRESAAIGTSHAFDILGEYLNANYVSPFIERVGTSPTVQSMEIVRPAVEPPPSWSSATSTEGASHWDSTGLPEVQSTCPPAQSGARVVVRHKAATPAQSGVSTVKETRGPRKRGAADQSIGTGASATNTQGTELEHVERKPTKTRISWANPASAILVTSPTRGVFKGIDGVESSLRNKYPRVNPLAQSDIRSDNRDSSNDSNYQTKHETNSCQRAFPANLIGLIREIREEEIPAPTAPEFVFELTSKAAERNFMILKKYNFDLAKAIEAQKSLPLGYGSEFWSPQTLKKIFMNHPLWNQMESLLIEGSK